MNKFECMQNITNSDLLRMNDNKFILIKYGKKIELLFYYNGGVFYHWYDGIKVKLNDKTIYVEFGQRYSLSLDGDRCTFRQKGRTYIDGISNYEKTILQNEIDEAIKNLILLEDL